MWIKAALAARARLRRKVAQSIPVARWFQIALGVIFLDAWLSLLYQVKILVGRRGLMPANEFVSLLRERQMSFFDAPTIFYWGAPDWALIAGCLVGAVLAILIVAGRYARPMLAISTLLYLSFVTIGRTFLSFQWDNLLLECGLFAVFLPTEKRVWWISFVFKLILFKLYFESGIAKWQSHLKDWHDGSAMSFYYETAPLPTFVAYYLHHLPVGWHKLESWATLAFELGVPFAIFGEKYLRRAAFVIFTAFQIINVITANYGFFCYLALALHLFLLDDATPPAELSRRQRIPGYAVLAIFVFISSADAYGSFVSRDLFLPLRGAWAPFRVVNTYHLFGHITRERIEPEVQTFDGNQWTARHFRHKPGDPARAPNFVAPHQPRVDFQLWFYGLSFRGGTPPWVVNLLDRVCTDPPAVERLFMAPLDAKPQAVRLLFWQYHFAASQLWWTREKLAETRAIPCRIDGARETDTNRP